LIKQNEEKVKIGASSDLLVQGSEIVLNLKLYIVQSGNKRLMKAANDILILQKNKESEIATKLVNTVETPEENTNAHIDLSLIERGVKDNSDIASRLQTFLTESTHQNDDIWAHLSLFLENPLPALKESLDLNSKNPIALACVTLHYLQSGTYSKLLPLIS
jgi:hypothetical protein